MKRTLCIAGFAIGLFCNQLYAGTSPEEMSRLFQSGVERLQAKLSTPPQAKPSSPHHITYDVKKTDSLLQPIIGILKIVSHQEVGDYYVDQIYDINFLFENGLWRINSMKAKSDHNGREYPEPGVPVELRQMIETCFTAQ